MTEYLENTIKRPIYPNLNVYIARFQSEILAIGYRFVMYKSKIKKRIYILRRMLTLFNI